MFMPPLFRSLVTALALIATLFAAPDLANAILGSCGQPQTNGANPAASDCLLILKTAVGSANCNASFNICICNTDGLGGITASDALRCLKKAVGQNITLNCPPPCGVPPVDCTTDGFIGCEAPLNTCTSARFVSEAGSDLDTGWNGLAHNQDLVRGASITLRSLRRCVTDAAHAPCLVDSDCPGADTCRPFCDCDDNSNSVCEITGPTVQPRCVRDLAKCTTNADCAGSQCQRFFGPPLPLTAANTPACVTTFFAEDLTGTADSETGSGKATAFLRSRVHLGIAQEKPCPRCGTLAQTPEVGDTFACDGGPNDGDPCTVEAVSDIFGGVSNDCPPDVTTNISGQGLAIRFLNVTTGADSKTAEIPCIQGGVCTDDLVTQCTTNAECVRCTNDLSDCTPAGSNGTCSGGATCAAAPDQPISCGFYCHCGFCNNDPTLPCFNDSECDAGQTCQAGDSTTGTQTQPNFCTDLVCGRDEPERCCSAGDPNCPAGLETPQTGECSLKRWISCNNNSECTTEGGGTCILEDNPCFGHKISRQGAPSPLGRHCATDPAVGNCTTNSDCGVGQCVGDTSEPTTVALFCVPKTASSAINSAGGIPGPGAITFKGVVFACRCGDGTKGCDEECDDGNNTNLDGCDQACQSE